MLFLPLASLEINNVGIGHQLQIQTVFTLMLYNVLCST